MSDRKTTVKDGLVCCNFCKNCESLFDPEDPTDVDDCAAPDHRFLCRKGLLGKAGSCRLKARSRTR